MKKALTLLLAAALSGLASAVTVSWNGATSRELTNVDFSKDITVVYSYTLTSAVSTSSGNRRNMLWLGFVSGTYEENKSLEFRNAPTWAGPNLISFNTNADSNHTLLSGALGSVGERTLTFTFNVESKTCSITFMDSTLQEQTASLTLKDMNAASSLWVNTYDISEFSASSTSITYTETPEPTVMALLAIGVAGLALRRKQA